MWASVRISQKDVSDSFRVADHSGGDAIFVNTSPFIVTYVVKLPRSRLERSRVAADAFACCWPTVELI